MGPTATEADLSPGLAFVGEFAGVEDRDRGDPVLVLKLGEGYRRAIEFAAYSPRTGEPTPVGEGLSGLSLGDRVIVGVFLNIRPAGVSEKTGREYAAFPTYRARYVARLS